MLPTLATLLMAMALAVSPGPGATLGTRQAELLARRAEKAQKLEKERPGSIERALVSLENDRILERALNPPVGLYPRIGHVTPGSGLSFGAGYRVPRLLGRRSVFSVSGLASFKEYWQVETRLLMPGLAGDRAEVGLYAERYWWPQEAFFGLGPYSLRASQTNFSLDNTVVGGSTTIRAAGPLSFGGRVEFLRPRAGPGQADAIASIEDVFGPRQTPGLGDLTNFGRFEAFAELNYREPRGNPRRGGRYYASYAAFKDVDPDRYSFGRVEIDLQQYVPLLRDRRVLAFHALLSASAGFDGQEVPFYLMRTLGGPDDLRGFRRNRFRDRNLLLLQAEYRWEAFTAVDAALFVDVAQVAPRVADFAMARFEKDFGFGFRFGSVNGVFLRLEGAFGSRDGAHFVSRFGHVF